MDIACHTDSLQNRDGTEQVFFTVAFRTPNAVELQNTECDNPSEKFTKDHKILQLLKPLAFDVTAKQVVLREDGDLYNINTVSLLHHGKTLLAWKRTDEPCSTHAPLEGVIRSRPNDPTMHQKSICELKLLGSLLNEVADETFEIDAEVVDVAADVWVPHGDGHEADQGAMQTLLDLRLAARTRAG